jgi:hypothetical protein
MLNDFGLLPEGVHDCDVAEINAVFCGNPHRMHVWQGFTGFLGWITDKPKPHAILWTVAS